MAQVDLHGVVKVGDVRYGCTCVVIPLTNGECSIKRASTLAGADAPQGQDTIRARKMDRSLPTSKQFPKCDQHISNQKEIAKVDALLIFLSFFYVFHYTNCRAIIVD